jgi:hypothetical protein
MAVAHEQEMRARVVEAEAEVPMALAEAFRSGRLGIMDHYRMENIQADTTMRARWRGATRSRSRRRAKRRRGTMVGRLLDTLRSLGGGAGEPPPRPNQLRREPVRAERLRREAVRPRTPPGRPAPAAEERAGPKAPSTAPDAASRAESHPVATALASRGALRRAWLVKEVLGPPRALRPVERELES